MSEQPQTPVQAQAIDRRMAHALLALCDFRADVRGLAQQGQLITGADALSQRQLVDQLHHLLGRIQRRLADLALDEDEAPGVTRRPEASRYPSLQRGQDRDHDCTDRP